MGIQIIPEPPVEGKEQTYCIWSSIVDAIVFFDATEQEIHDYLLAETVERFEKEHAYLMSRITAGEPRVYAQFTKTYEEALAKHEENHGPLEGIEV